MGQLPSIAAKGSLGDGKRLTLDLHPQAADDQGQRKQALDGFKEGRYRVLVDANQHVDREGARRAGLGFYGKNTMLITREHGSWVVLGTLVTDVEVEAVRDAGHPASGSLESRPDLDETGEEGALVQPLAEERVVVTPRVPRKAPFSHTRLGAFDPVTQRGRDNGLRRAVKEQLRMTGDLRPRHRELHVREKALLVPLADVLLGLQVRRRRSSANDVEAEIDCDLGELSRRHCNRLGLRAHTVIDSASDPGILGRSPSPGS